MSRSKAKYGQRTRRYYVFRGFGVAWHILDRTVAGNRCGVPHGLIVSFPSRTVARLECDKLNGGFRDETTSKV